VHHEVQYLSFTGAMARRRKHLQSLSVHFAINETYSTHVSRVERGLRAEASFIASFLFWPVVGFGGARSRGIVPKNDFGAGLVLDPFSGTGTSDQRAKKCRARDTFQTPSRLP
jgi:hypothetical protein